MKRFIITTVGNVYLNDFTTYEEAHEYFSKLDIECKLYDTETGVTIWK